MYACVCVCVCVYIYIYIYIYKDTILLFHTDAHNYQNHGNIKTIKIPTLAPTCFGSRKNHLQGAVSCLAKTTYDSMCSSLLT